MNKIAIFVDVQNIYYTTRDTFSRQFNYHKLWHRISEQGEIVCANAYATHRGDEKTTEISKCAQTYWLYSKTKTLYST